MSENTKAIAVVGPDNRGIEDMDTGDLVIPHYILCQPTTRFVTGDKTGKVRAGMFYNTLTKEVFSEIVFIPLVMTKHYDLLKHDQIKDRMIFEGRVFDKNDPRLLGRRMFKDKTTGERANVKSVLRVVCSINDVPALLDFKGGSYKCGQELLTAAKFSKQSLWAKQYKLTAKQGDVYFNQELSCVGDCNAEQLSVAENLYMTFKLKQVNSGEIEDGEDVGF